MEFNVITAGESHGKGIVSVIRGFPSGVDFDRDLIDRDLRRRQGGYGRGGRMEIESDSVQVLSGFYHGKSLGTPITFWIKNRDWDNWKEFISPEERGEESREVNTPRPGHTDLAGALQRGYRDCRKVLERTSARETAGRVAAGGLAKTLLRYFGIEVVSRVVRIGGVEDPSDPEPRDWPRLTSGSPVRVAGNEVEGEMMAEIDRAGERGDSLGGVFTVAARGVPPGIGSYRESRERLDSRLSAAFMSIPAIKSVEVGLGREVGEKPGSEVHDEIYHDEERGFYRGSNNGGGIEGGVSNGETVEVSAAMKPIPTLTSPLDTVDLVTGAETSAAKERSDVCAVPAASIVGEAEMAVTLTVAFLAKFGGDTLEEIERSYTSYISSIDNWYGGG
ncbi:MAG: chorismate synthase [Candidatus Bipolaricaulota bacterium]